MRHDPKRGEMNYTGCANQAGLFRWVAVLLFCLTMIALPALGAGPIPATPKVPAEFQLGEGKFTALCARCHGPQGSGTTQGPPLVHKIYEPNHHGDAAFQRAALNGVRAHHWQFGDMPKIEGATSADVDEIVKYVRWLQRQAGIM